jgi:hypothetical protein
MWTKHETWTLDPSVGLYTAWECKRPQDKQDWSSQFAALHMAIMQHESRSRDADREFQVPETENNN